MAGASYGDLVHCSISPDENALPAGYDDLRMDGAGSGGNLAASAAVVDVRTPMVVEGVGIFSFGLGGSLGASPNRAVRNANREPYHQPTQEINKMLHTREQQKPYFLPVSAAWHDRLRETDERVARRTREVRRELYRSV